MISSITLGHPAAPAGHDGRWKKIPINSTFSYMTVYWMWIKQNKCPSLGWSSWLWFLLFGTFILFFWPQPWVPPTWLSHDVYEWKSPSSNCQLEKLKWFPTWKGDIKITSQFYCWTLYLVGIINQTKAVNLYGRNIFQNYVSRNRFRRIPEA